MLFQIVIFEFNFSYLKNHTAKGLACGTEQDLHVCVAQEIYKYILHGIQIMLFVSIIVHVFQKWSSQLIILILVLEHFYIRLSF